MPSQTQAFDDLNRLPDALHAWITRLTTTGSLDAEAATLLALALHEWAANLVQHARWTAAPRIVVSVAETDGRLLCAVEDTSTGFDLGAALDERSEGFEALPERGMGLLMLNALADDLTYAPALAAMPAEPGSAACPPGPCQRLSFCLRTDGPGFDVTQDGTAS